MFNNFCSSFATGQIKNDFKSELLSFETIDRRLQRQVFFVLFSMLFFLEIRLVKNRIVFYFLP